MRIYGKAIIGGKMRLRPFILDKDFDAIKDWIADERSHAFWCANRFSFPLEKKNFGAVIEEHALVIQIMPVDSEQL